MTTKLQDLLDEFYSLDEVGNYLGETTLHSLSAAELEKSIDLEIAGDRQSKTIIRRLHQRLCALRRDTERERVAKFDPKWHYTNVL